MQKMIDPDAALELVLQHATRRPLQRRELEAALGLVLAHSVTADRDYPPFHRAMMDGYAVRVADAGARVQLVGEVAAGQAPGLSLESGSCVAIMTGAPCPEETEAVVKIEDTSRQGDLVQLPDRIPEGQHIAARGCECPAGQVVLERGVRVTPLVAAVLASVGRLQVEVIRPPTAAVITTGSELAALARAAASLGPAQIRDSNGPMLAAQVRQSGGGAGAAPLVLHAADTMESLAQALAQAAEADVVLLSGGVSMGRYDLVPRALERFGATLVLHKVTQKPGKPLLLGLRGQQMIFGLPGNPLSSHFCFHRYVAPSLRCMAGLEPGTELHTGTLTADLRTRGSRTKFMLAQASAGDQQVTPLPGKGSADIFAAPTANAYVRVPGGPQQLRTGDQVQFQWVAQRR